VVTLICDSGERYLQTYYDDVWMAQTKVDLEPWRRQLVELHETGAWRSAMPYACLDELGNEDEAPG
jgi:hypothetical protein